MSNKISIYKGDSLTVSVVIKDLDGNAFDLTDFTAYLTIKNSTNKITEIDKLTGVVSLPKTLGVVMFNFLPADTINYEAGNKLYDIRITDGVDTFTLLTESFKILTPLTTI